MSNSQIGQDLWVLEKTKYKKNGFFVEAGACDGLIFSNTFFLEKDYNWSGICCEPNINYFNLLKNNRKCLFDNRALYEKDELEIEFFPANEIGGTFQDFKEEPSRIIERTKFLPYKVKTVSLNTLLDQHNAPSQIDYISLDTEGSELKILQNFNFNKYKVKIFSVEHNTEQRKDNGLYLSKIIELFNYFGYNYEINQWDCYFIKQ
jgi:FkbM family methyltransferase